MVPTKRLLALGLVAMLAIATFVGVTSLSRAQESEPSRKVVFIVPVKGMVDPGLFSLVKRAIKEAELQEAQAIIFEIDTFGGRVDSATQIRDAMFATDIKTVAFIKNRAISAGALIALACQHIVVAPGSSIGAATPIEIGISPLAGEVKPTGEKEVSYVRAEFAATAERNGHNPLLAKAMVDGDVELYTRTVDLEMEIIEVLSRPESEDAPTPPEGAELLIAKGKLLTLSGEETLRLGLAEHEVEGIGSILNIYNLRGARLVTTEMNWSEMLARFFTHPILSGLLLTFGVLGIMYELRIPGWGVSGTIGVICLALFFGAHLLVGLAEWFEILLFFVGVGLLIAEIFFIPGFGIAGISGIGCLLLALYLTLVKSPIPRYSWEMEQFRHAMFTFVWFGIGFITLVVVTWKLLPRTPLYAWIVQTSEERSDLGFAMGSAKIESYLGKTGRTATVLRPAGRARFGGRLVDVVADGEFIPADTLVRVVDVKGTRVVVVPEEDNRG